MIWRFGGVLYLGTDGLGRLYRTWNAYIAFVEG